jgi:hypothetical protein
VTEVDASVVVPVPDQGMVILLTIRDVGIQEDQIGRNQADSK